MTSHAAPQRAQSANVRQRRMRRRSSTLPLRRAVRLAVDVFFQFQYRAKDARALWCESEHLWMGRETFLHWALWDASINVPWVVRGAADAPAGADELFEVVVAELKRYWEEQVALLPRAGRPDWLPLP